jgi:hypothetical protein
MVIVTVEMIINSDDNDDSDSDSGSCEDDDIN